MRNTALNVLCFDRYALDLTRCCLRAGDEEIELRPKAFEVLRHLALNAGILVSKQDLCQAAWPNVTVSDDSLVQCIRELRQKLGDHEHLLIKTVSRRGYLLDTMLRAPSEPRPAVRMGVVQWLRDQLISPQRDWPQRDWPRALMARIAVLGRETPNRTLVVAGSALLCAAAGGAYLLAAGTKPVDSGARPEARYAANSVVAEVSRATFKDCTTCPKMVELPAGEFLMGSPADEVGRKQSEGPQRRVTIARRFAVGKFEVTIDQFSAFVSETGLAADNKCQVMLGSEGDKERWSQPQASFLKPGFEVTGSHPAVCVSGHEAQAYVTWLKRRTGKPYRLPTEAEWEYAARAGTTTNYSFGIDETELCSYARFADLGSPFRWRGGCRGEAVPNGTLRVGSLKPNQWGIADMHGNAWEWVEDCWTPDVRKIPTDGSAFTQPGGCEVGVIRGGGFASSHASVRSARRKANIVAKHYQTVGFRVALSLDAQ